MRDEKGRFVKGVSSSPDTQFKKGQHWRKPQLFRDRDWLLKNYVELQRSTGEIAKEFGVTDSAVLFWLKRHNIPRRDISQSRAIKYWGLSGVDNPMWNKRGELNKNWKGGNIPERTKFYSSFEWRRACYIVWRRDEATCQRCFLRKKDSSDMPFHIHHIVSFLDKELRAELSNLVLLCEVCHHFVHSKANIDREFLCDRKIDDSVPLLNISTHKEQSSLKEDLEIEDNELFLF